MNAEKITITLLNADAAYAACRILDERFDADFENHDVTKITLRARFMTVINEYMNALHDEEIIFTNVQFA